AEEVLRIAPRGTGPWSQGMMVKLLCTIQAGNLEEFESLIGIATATAPAPSAVTPWALCVVIEIVLLDLLGRARVANHPLPVLGAGIATTGDQEPLAAAIFHAIGALRTAYAEQDPVKGLKHAEAYRDISEATGHRLYREVAKLFIGMNRWYLGALAG